MLDKDLFAQAQETLRSGLYVVTSAVRRTIAGCTCVWVSRAGFMPPLMSVVLAPTRQTFEAIESSGRFCINVLGENNIELARKFGFQTGFEADKFAGVDWHKGKSGSPVLDSAVSYFDCQVASISDAGDHKLVLGVTIDARVQSSERPAVYVAESFYGATPLEQVAAQAAEHQH